MPQFTVFTPTYNRVTVLPRVYASLCAQTFTDFEWLIVDDGSSDGTAELVRTWQAEASFPIRYLWQENAHKKAAFNRAVAQAHGELFLPLDSDDTCPANALEIFDRSWQSLPQSTRTQLAGVTALCVDESGRIVGDRFPQDAMLISSLDLAYRHRVGGEKWGFTRLEVLKQFPFPLDLPGHVPEGVVWGAIGQHYKTLFVNEVVRTYYRSDDSIMVRGAAGLDVRKNAAGQAYWARLVLSHELAWFRFAPGWFLRMAANWARFGVHDWIARGQRLSWPTGFAARALCALALGPGLLLAWRDARRVRKVGA